MPTELVPPEAFLTRLEEAMKGEGSVWLTAKRYTYGEDDPMSEDGEHDVILRAAGAAKFSTRIPASSLPQFHATYGALLKSAMGAHMRKRDKKRERARAEAQAKRRKELYTDVKIEGVKRGAGRRQRQRRVAAQKKKEAAREALELKEQERAAKTDA